MNEIKKITNTKYSFPHWRTIASTYPEAVQKRLDEIKATRPFYNYREGEIDGNHLHQTEEKILGIEKCTQNQTVTIEVQLGQKYKGVAVETVRKSFDKGEFGLGAYEMACILLADPTILQSSDDLWIDCPGDEFSHSGDRFDRAPCLDFSDDLVKFDAGHVSNAYDYYGSGSAFLPQPLETGNLESSFVSLSLESAVQIVKDAGYVVYKEM